MSMHHGITLTAVGLEADMTMTTTITVIGMTTMVTAMAMDMVQGMVVVADVTKSNFPAFTRAGNLQGRLSVFFKRCKHSVSDCC